MRLATLAIGLAVLAPTGVLAQTVARGPTASASPGISDQSLSDALFVGPASADPAIRARGGGDAAAFGEVFVTPAFLGEGLSGQPLATGRVAATGEGLIAWRSSEMSHAAGGGAVDSVRLSVAQVSRAPLLRPDAAYEPGAVDLTFTRGWPNAMLVRAGGVGLNVSPHAGFGLDSTGGNSAEAGAMFRFSSIRTAVQDRLNAMGVRNGAVYGDQGRWYVFAAVRGQSVGLNMTANANGALRQAGWSTDASSALVGDGQVGVGWRKGGLEASMGYVHRGIKVRNAPYGASDSFSESLAAMSLTFHPHW
ncbi:MAG: hypothetical protein JWO72_2979 [Caulobacteraceae bacterium]|nr:hypothetical protein [Caulobacteraceae bacterium]